MNRGEVWWAELDEPRASEPGYRHPVVVVSSNEFNHSAINTVLAAVITSNFRLVNAPGNFPVSGDDSGLPRDSVVNVSQLITLDKSFLTDQSGSLSASNILDLNEGLKLVLAV